MAEYIDKKRAIDRIASCYCIDCEHSNGILCRACEHQDDMDLIDEIPAADVQPVKRGRWENEYLDDDVWWADCTNCKNDTNSRFGRVSSYAFCPNCGARMIKDGEIDE